MKALFFVNKRISTLHISFNGCKMEILKLRCSYSRVTHHVVPM